MGEATFKAFVAHQLGGILAMADQPYEETAEDFRRGQTLQLECIRAEKERHKHQMDAWRAEFERGYLRPVRRALIDVVIDGEAAKVARPSIGKPLSRRARRRNRGRIRAAKIAMGRAWHQPVQWSWQSVGSPYPMN